MLAKLVSVALAATSASAFAPPARAAGDAATRRAAPLRASSSLIASDAMLAEALPKLARRNLAHAALRGVYDETLATLSALRPPRLVLCFARRNPAAESRFLAGLRAHFVCVLAHRCAPSAREAGGEAGEGGALQLQYHMLLYECAPRCERVDAAVRLQTAQRRRVAVAREPERRPPRENAQEWVESETL